MAMLVTSGSHYGALACWMKEITARPCKSTPMAGYLKMEQNLRRGDESQELVGTGRREWRGWEGFRRGLVEEAAVRGYIECRFGIRGEGRNVQETWHTILDTPYVAFYIPHWTGPTLGFTVYTTESTPLHFILYKLYFTFLAVHCTPDTPQEQETMGFSNLSIKYDNDGVP